MEKLKPWQNPENYFGENPDGYYLVYSQHRNSGLVQRCNYEYLLDFVRTRAKDYMHELRATHWLVGYVDHLFIHKDAPVEILQEIDGMLQSLDEYPILDDDAFAESEAFEAQEIWESLFVSERIEYCKEAGISIFSARRDLCPAEVFVLLVRY